MIQKGNLLLLLSSSASSSSPLSHQHACLDGILSKHHIPCSHHEVSGEHEVEKYKFTSPYIAESLLYSSSIHLVSGLLFGGIGIGLCLYYVSYIQESRRERSKRLADLLGEARLGSGTVDNRVTLLVL